MKIGKVLTIFILLFSLTGCGSKNRVTNIGSRGKSIICFGNSITEGIGASLGNDYPSILAQKLGIPVINSGLAGDTTGTARQRIYPAVLSKNPKLVIVELGGNDFLGGVSLENTFNNLDQIVQEIQAAGAMVVLLEIKTGLVDNYLESYKKIARKRKALLLPDILQGIMNKSQYMSDSIHPNDAGYALLAERVCQAIRPLLLQNKRRLNTSSQR